MCLLEWQREFSIAWWVILLLGNGRTDVNNSGWSVTQFLLRSHPPTFPVYPSSLPVDQIGPCWPRGAAAWLTSIQQLQVRHKRCVSICQGGEAHISQVQQRREDHEQILHLLQEKQTKCWESDLQKAENLKRNRVDFTAQYSYICGLGPQLQNQIQLWFCLFGELFCYFLTPFVNTEMTCCCSPVLSLHTEMSCRMWVVEKGCVNLVKVPEHLTSLTAPISDQHKNTRNKIKTIYEKIY